MAGGRPAGDRREQLICCQIPLRAASSRRHPLAANNRNRIGQEAFINAQSARGTPRPIHASWGFHLCIFPHAAQQRGTATGGSEWNTTELVVSPVGTGIFVVGHLMKMLLTGGPAWRTSQRYSAGSDAASARGASASARSARRTLTALLFPGLG